jgi:hypothetical protein
VGSNDLVSHTVQFLCTDTTTQCWEMIQAEEKIRTTAKSLYTIFKNEQAILLTYLGRSILFDHSCHNHLQDNWEYTVHLNLLVVKYYTYIMHAFKPELPITADTRITYVMIKYQHCNRFYI